MLCVYIHIHIHICIYIYFFFPVEKIRMVRSLLWYQYKLDLAQIYSHLRKIRY